MHPLQSGNNISNNGSGKEGNVTLGLANLFRTLDDLDHQLGGIKQLLLEKEANIRLLTEDYRDIKENNRRLDYSYLPPDVPTPTIPASNSNAKTLFVPCTKAFKNKKDT